nr:hypothetical protein [Lachnospiraceae bacterium]
MKNYNVIIRFIIVMVISLTIATHTYYADSDILEIDCTEKEAYEKGYDFYRTWYLINKGDFCRVFYGYYPPYHSIVTRNRNDWSYSMKVNEWRILTLNLTDELNHSEKERAYCEALLFNLLYNENDSNMFTMVTSGASGSIGELNKAAKNLGFSAWKKLYKGLSWSEKVDVSTKIDSLTVAQIEDLQKQTSWLYKNYAKANDIVKLLELTKDVGEYIDGLCKLSELIGTNQEMSEILRDMANDTSNSAYSSALNDFSLYLSDSVSYEDAVGIYTGSTATRLASDKMIELAWKALIYKNLPLLGVDTGAKIGKFLSDSLTGIDDQFNKYNELEVYYDMEKLLHEEVDNLLYEIQSGETDNAKMFITAYGMLLNMYNIGMDCYEEYTEKMYKEGLLNNVFSGMQSEKYNNAIAKAESVRSSVNKIFETDIANADIAFKVAAKKYESDNKDADTIIDNYDTAADNIEEEVDNFEEHRYSFGYTIKEDIVQDKDLEIYGCLIIDYGSLDLNGHKIVVYGDAIVHGDLWLNGILDVKGSLYQYREKITIKENGQLLVGNDFYQKGGSVLISGGTLSVGGNHEIGYIDGEGAYKYYDYTKLTINEGGTESIGGSVLAYNLYSSDLTKGTLNVYGDFRAFMKGILAREEFEIVLAGEGSARVENISAHLSGYNGGNLTVENADGRSIVFAGEIGLNNLTGEGLVIISDGASIGATLQTDVTIEGDVAVPYAHKLHVNGKNLVVNGSVQMTSDTMTVDGTMTIKDDFYQKGGSVVISGGTLSVGGNHEIGYVDAEGEYKYS